MSKGPGLYFDFGKKARDLLRKNYGQQPTTHYQYQDINWSFDLACQIEDIVPGFNTVFRFIIPDSGKVELQYLQDYFGISAGAGLKANVDSSGYDPVLNFSGVVGSTLLSLGTDLSFDITTGEFNKFNAGLSFNSELFIASLTMNNKFSAINASCYQALNPLTNTALAAELKHSFLNNGATTLTIGGQHGVFPYTLLKARASSDGKVGCMVQQELWQKLYLAISGEVDFMANSKVPKIGFSMAVRP